MSLLMPADLSVCAPPPPPHRVIQDMHSTLGIASGYMQEFMATFWQFQTGASLGHAPGCQETGQAEVSCLFHGSRDGQVWAHSVWGMQVRAPCEPGQAILQGSPLMQAGQAWRDAVLARAVAPPPPRAAPDTPHWYHRCGQAAFDGAIPGGAAPSDLPARRPVEFIATPPVKAPPASRAAAPVGQAAMGQGVGAPTSQEGQAAQLDMPSPGHFSASAPAVMPLPQCGQAQPPFGQGQGMGHSAAEAAAVPVPATPPATPRATGEGVGQGSFPPVPPASTQSGQDEQLAWLRGQPDMAASLPATRLVQAAPAPQAAMQPAPAATAGAAASGPAHSAWAGYRPQAAGFTQVTLDQGPPVMLSRARPALSDRPASGSSRAAANEPPASSEFAGMVLGQSASCTSGPRAKDVRPVNYRGQEPQWCDNGRDRVGFKVFVGDLPAHTQARAVLEWAARDSALGQAWAQSADLHVHCTARSASGSVGAICTVATAQAAYDLYNAAWLWWARVPEAIESRGWRWLQVRFFNPSQGPGQ